MFVLAANQELNLRIGAEPSTVPLHRTGKAWALVGLLHGDKTICI